MCSTPGHAASLGASGFSLKRGDPARHATAITEDAKCGCRLTSWWFGHSFAALPECLKPFGAHREVPNGHTCVQRKSGLQRSNSLPLKAKMVAASPGSDSRSNNIGWGIRDSHLFADATEIHQTAVNCLCGFDTPYFASRSKRYWPLCHFGGRNDAAQRASGRHTPS